MLNKLRYISAQPANRYFAWQVDVMLYNFKSMDVDMSKVDVLCAINNNIIPDDWKALRQSHEANFYFYNDTRESPIYIPSIRPNMLKQHFLAYPELENEVLFYHDCDIVFSKPPSEWITQEMIEDDNWYGSNVNSYINYDYIISKGQQVFDLMVSTIGIDPQYVIDNNKNCIGAQYILKGTDYSFWDTVERKSEELYSIVSKLNAKIKLDIPDYHEIQIWCACMWTVLWNGWMMGKKTIAHPNLEFSWGTSLISEYYQYNIMHNAGVTDNLQGLFFKGKYTDSYPYGKNLQIKENMASKMYYEWIQKAEKLTSLKYQ
jgi:hypothetical protein